MRAAGLQRIGGSDGGSSPLHAIVAQQSVPLPVRDGCSIASKPGSVHPNLDHTFLPPTAAFSSAAAAVVTLRAERVSLPSSLHVVPLISVLPPEVGARYAQEESGLQLLRPLQQRLELDAQQPLSRPRVAGERCEYVALIRRLHALGMVSFTATPLAVNGVFTVGKDADSDRLIIDAQPANRCFVDSPHVSLPDASHLVQLQVPHGRRVSVGKSDLSNFYHHLALPVWMQPYFALPALRPEELAALGLPLDKPYPMCTTLPMGFSHAVFLANSAHEHVLYSSGAVRREHNLLCASSPVVSDTHALHGLVIDDFFLFALDQREAQRELDRVLAAYAAVGFVVKQSKLVTPTAEPVKVIGFEVGGPDSLLRLPADSMLSLLEDTVSLLQRGRCTGLALAHLIGRWTWGMMVRRASLSLLQRVYRFIQQADHRCFELWPSVRSELWSLLGIAPLLHARLDAPVHPRVVASDASELAAGVVATALTEQLQEHMQPLCSTRKHASMQTLLQYPTREAPVANLAPGSEVQCFRLAQYMGDDLSAEQQQQLLQLARDAYAGFYSEVAAARWSRVLSAPWRTPEHINVLELRAVLLALHWLLSYPSVCGHRVFLLVDSTVALFFPFGRVARVRPPFFWCCARLARCCWRAALRSWWVGFPLL